MTVTFRACRELLALVRDIELGNSFGFAIRVATLEEDNRANKRNISLIYEENFILRANKRRLTKEVRELRAKIEELSEK